MFRKLTAALILAGTIAAGAANAESRRHADHNSWQRGVTHVHWKSEKPGRPHHVRRHAGRHRVLELPVHRKVKNSVLPLRRMFGLDRDYRGYRVDAVVVKLRSHRHRGHVKLLVNGHAVDGERVRGSRSVYLRLDDERVLGRGLHSLKLDVRGKMYVKSIKLKMTRAHGHRHVKHTPAPVKVDIEQRRAERLAELIMRQLYAQWRHR